MTNIDELTVLVTGAKGFIGKNLCLRLFEQRNIRVLKYLRGESEKELERKLLSSNFVVHLAGENRPISEDYFKIVNVDLTKKISDILVRIQSKVPVVFASSAQVTLDNTYGNSKRSAEVILKALSEKNGNPVIIYRLNGVFGKWCKPNYNSVVATFCHNIANGIPINVHDPNKKVSLVYVDDVIDNILSKISARNLGVTLENIDPIYNITVDELARTIESFHVSRTSLSVDRVGSGLLRALYATFVSYYPSNEFSYELPMHKDHRGLFIEMLKTQDSGQISVFSAKPGVTRGGHYHHTKIEKFLVVQGQAEFRFNHIITSEYYSLRTSAEKSEIVETVPGWSHDITNIGNEELIVILWANEVFDPELPDTISHRVQQ